jgi:hypothetical protein
LALAFGPWAVATLIELIVGYAIAQAILKEIRNSKTNNSN